MRFDRKHLGRAIVYFKGERMGEARPVDFIANDRMPKTRDAHDYDNNEHKVTR